MDESPDKRAAPDDAVRALDRLGAPHAVVGGVVRSTIERGSIAEALTGAGLFDPEFDPMIDRAEPLDITGVRIRVVTTVDLIAMKERASLLRGDIPDPDEGW